MIYSDSRVNNCLGLCLKIGLPLFVLLFHVNSLAAFDNTTATAPVNSAVSSNMDIPTSTSAAPNFALTAGSSTSSFLIGTNGVTNNGTLNFGAANTYVMTSTPTGIPFTSPAALANSATTFMYSGYYTFTFIGTLGVGTGGYSCGNCYPAYYGVDLWAESYDVQGNSVPIRILYTGDLPYVINETSYGSLVLIGGAYLRAGAILYSPRLWSLNSQSGYGVSLVGTLQVNVMQSSLFHNAE